MKRLLITFVLFCFAFVAVSAQVSAPDPSQIGRDTAQQLLQEVSVDSFEDSGFWVVAISPDDGIATHRLFEGSAGGKTPLAGGQQVAAGSDDNVLGVRIDYFRRGNTTIAVSPLRPLQVAGITKTISVWVAGRNYNHDLSVVVEDFAGQRFTIPMGKMNFSGWRQLSAAVPVRVEQVHPNYSDRQGLQIVGLLVDPALVETYGSYYVYFDDLRVWTDLFSEDTRDPSDIEDNW